MKVRHGLICFFLLSLVNAEINVYKRTEGGNIRVACEFNFPGSKRFFCKEKCEEGNILIETTHDSDQRGRYSLQYKREGLELSPTLYVSISQLIKSDSGRYICSLDRWILDGFVEFEIRVTDAPTASVPSASTPPGSFRSSSSSPETTEQSDQQHTDRPTTPPASPAPTTPPSSDVLSYVGVALTIMVVLLSLGLLVFCKMRTNNNKDPSADTELTSVTEANRVNEEIREDRRSRSPPEASSVPVYANFTKPTETTCEYSSVTAASSQHKTEDDQSKLVYSQVDFSNSAAAASLHSDHVTSGHANDVIYSVPLVQESSDGNYDSSPPLYSVISKH